MIIGEKPKVSKKEKKNKNKTSKEPKEVKDVKEPTKEEKSKISQISKLNPEIQKILNGLGYESLTKVQNQMILEILDKKHEDIICTSEKGSGKMLSFLLPIIHNIKENDPKEEIIRRYIIVTGTKERADDLYSLSKEIMQDINGNYIVMCTGGANRKKEYVKLLNKEVKLIITTPQRLVEHILNDKNNKLILTKEISTIIFDKVENMEKNGFIKELKEIINIFGFIELEEEIKSAHIIKDNVDNETINKDINFIFYLEKEDEDKNNFNINDLITFSKRSFKKILINQDLKNTSNNNNKKEKSSLVIKQRGYIVIDPSKKFLFLLTFLRKNLLKKVIVLFSTNKEVIFYKSLLNLYHIEITTLDSGSTHNIKSNNTIISDFNKKEKGILFCSDLYKMKIDLPVCDWIIFYDSPQDIDSFDNNLKLWDGESYVGNIKSFMILFPTEIDLLKEKGTYKINEFNLNMGQIEKDQEKVEKLVNKKDHSVLVNAFEAYRAFLFSYVSRNNKNVFDLEKVDVTKLCKSFGFEYPPFVNFDSVLNLDTLNESNKKKSYLFPEEIEKIYGKK